MLCTTLILQNISKDSARKIVGFNATLAQFKMRSLLNTKMFIILNQILVKIFLLCINHQRHFKSFDLRWVWNYFHKKKLRKTKDTTSSMTTSSNLLSFQDWHTYVSKHLTCSKMDRVFKFGLRSKNSSNTSLYMLQV